MNATSPTKELGTMVYEVCVSSWLGAYWYTSLQIALSMTVATRRGNLPEWNWRSSSV